MFVSKDTLAIAHCVSMFSALAPLMTNGGVHIRDFLPGASLGQELFDMLDTLVEPVVLQLVGDLEIHFDLHTLYQINAGVAITHTYALVQVVEVKGGVAVAYRYYLVTQNGLTPERFAIVKEEHDKHSGIGWDEDGSAYWVG